MANLADNEPRVAIHEDADFMKRHQEDMARRQRERDERCPPEERLRLCDGVYAGIVEARKPVYKWTVEATIHETIQAENRDRFDFSDEEEPGQKFVPRTITGTVCGQNEADAWAEFCDHIRMWPSRRTAKPKFTRGDEVDPLTHAVKARTPAYHENHG